MKNKKNKPLLLIAHIIMVITGIYLASQHYLQQKDVLLYTFVFFTVIYIILAYINLRLGDLSNKKIIKRRLYLSIITLLIWVCFVVLSLLSRYQICSIDFIGEFHWIFLILGTVVDIGETLISIDIIVELIRRDLSGGLLLPEE